MSNLKIIMEDIRVRAKLEGTETEHDLSEAKVNMSPEQIMGWLHEIESSVKRLRPLVEKAHKRGDLKGVMLKTVGLGVWGIISVLGDVRNTLKGHSRAKTINRRFTDSP
jgi:hypothetical protein